MSINIDKQGLEAIARGFLSDILAFFESEEGQREFEEWKQRKTAVEEHDEQDDTD